MAQPWQGEGVLQQHRPLRGVSCRPPSPSPSPLLGSPPSPTRGEGDSMTPRAAVRRPALRDPAVLIGPATATVLVVLGLPLLLLFRFSFNRFVPGQFMVEALTLENYAKFFAD